MLFEITEYYTGEKIRLKPRVELYDTRDYMGKQMTGLAIVLDEVDQNENVTEQYAVLTVSFGDFLTMKTAHSLTPTTARLRRSSFPTKSRRIPVTAKSAAIANILCGCSRRTS